jgi:type II secretory pathway pseudopilin PulG
VKNSFTLFETILALTIISILIGGFLKSSNNTSISSSNLQLINNDFLLNKTENIAISKYNYSYEINSHTIVNITNENIYTKYIYNTNNIYFEKFNLDIIPNSLNFKEFK